MTTMYHSAFSKVKKIYSEQRVLTTAAAALIIFGVMVLLGLRLLVHPATSQVSSRVQLTPLSRTALMIAEGQIRQTKPAPTEAAREYAYVASAYDDALKANGQAGGLYAAQQILHLFYPNNQAQIDRRINSLASARKLYLYKTGSVPQSVSQIVKKYEDRNLNDGHDLAWDHVIPQGPGKWVKKTAKDPLTPRAGDWQRWVVSQPISVPPPPTFGSNEDLQQVRITAQAAANRTGNDVNKINFWGGTPGTNGPSGIWQDQLYKTIAANLPANAQKADQQYSQTQALLSEVLSDAFMECWKVKYTYWTARPDMRAPEIITAMDDPNFPSYISGHSTISKAAADLLSILVPSHSKQWEAMAVEARDSRLKAGIHFDIDNNVGFDVGTEVARQYRQTLQLRAIIQ